jgi:spermidine/putrescine-binding protein
MHPCSYGLHRWRKARLLQPLDEGRLPNLADLWDGLKTVPGTVEEGRRYFVPFDCGHASVLYRNDLVDPADVEEESWGLLFDENYAGRLAMYDGGTEMVEIAARMLGHETSATLEEADFHSIKRLLLRQRQLTRFYWRDAAEIEHALADGEIVAAFAWNDSALRVRDLGAPVRFMEPKEGRLTWVCGFVRHAGALASEDAAHDFIDAMLAPETGKALIETCRVGHANRKAYGLVEPDLLDRLGWPDPPTSFARCLVPQEAEEPYRSRCLNLVNEVRAGLN